MSFISFTKFSWSSFAIIFQPNTSRFHPPFPYVRIRYICLIKDLSVVQDPLFWSLSLSVGVMPLRHLLLYMMRRICSLNPMNSSALSSLFFFPCFWYIWIFDIPFADLKLSGYLCLGYVGSLVYLFHIFTYLLISLSDTNLVQFLIICTMHLWTKLIGNICSMASLNPLQPVNTYK